MPLRENPRICFLSTLGELGGAEVCLLDTITVLRERHPQWQLHLIVPADGSLGSRVRELGVQVSVIPFPDGLSRLGDSHLGDRAQSREKLALPYKAIATLPAVAAYGFRLRQCLRSYQPDVLYANGFKAEILAAISKPRSSQLIWHTHDYVSSRPFVARVFRRCAGSCHTIIANSQSIAEDIRPLVRPNAAVRVIHNTVDLDRFSPTGERLDLDQLSGAESAPAGTVRVGLIATMAWWKGHRTFLEAISRFKDMPIRGYVIGGPIYRTAGSENSLTALRAEAQSLGIADRIGFTGFVPDIAAAIRSLDIVVHASTRPEPFGRVLIEAMACGKPVITTGLGGAAEIISAGPGTMTFWPGEADDLAKAISCLVFDATRRKSLGDLARKTAVQHFGRNKLVEELDLLLHALAPATQQIVIESPGPLEEKMLAPGI